MKYDEGECPIDLGGQKFVALGAVIDEKRAWVYIDEKSNVVTSWHGDKLGTYEITSVWKSYTHNATFNMRAIRITLIDGSMYHGRYSPDSGSLCKARRYK